MVYATVSDIQDRTGRTFTNTETIRVLALLEDAGAIIDSVYPSALEGAKKVVSCRMVIRALGEENGDPGVPIGATQGSMAAGGYSQSWTISGGGSGELYLGKADRDILRSGLGRIGCSDPFAHMKPCGFWNTSSVTACAVPPSPQGEGSEEECGSD